MNDKFAIRKNFSDKLILTCGDSNYSHFLNDWYLSLKKTGYSGHIGILDFGISDIGRFNVIRLKSMNYTKYHMTDRHIDYMNFLKSYKPNTIVLITDSDLWFNDNIDEIFSLAQHNLCFVPDVKTNWIQKNEFTNSDKSFKLATAKLEKLQVTTGTINAGVIAGPSKLLIERYEKYFSLFKDSRLKGKFGDDQFALNYLLEPHDIMLERKWNHIYSSTTPFQLINQVIFCNNVRTKIVHLAGDFAKSKFRYSQIFPSQ